MHIAFLTNPASGQVNVQLATAQQLVSQDHRVTFLSAESCCNKIDRFRIAQPASKHDLIRFISLGSGRTVDDLYVSFAPLPCSALTDVWLSTSFIQDRMPLMRRAPGDPVSLEMCIEAALGPAEEHAAIAIAVHDHLNVLDPNMSEFSIYRLVDDMVLADSVS